ncbi:hypothetical protein NPIL_354321 [Nephila pilipes]|uniref:Uncharacterized protein n=1 Tax=Nephila pilipes TaxID=299642 RepID=A0A8X6THY4_NEPPI|nr:hypothetical protein NPIL_354321 [Nephila pilipes]
MEYRSGSPKERFKPEAGRSSEDQGIFRVRWRSLGSRPRPGWEEAALFPEGQKGSAPPVLVSGMGIGSGIHDSGRLYPRMRSPGKDREGMGGSFDRAFYTER